MEQYEQFVLNACTREEKGTNSQTIIMVPDPLDVTTLACMELLKLSREQCSALIKEVPEANLESDAYKAIVKRIYAPNSWYTTTEQQAAATQIAVINAVIAKYNSKIT